ncbi:aspartate aminotransferase family protein [Mycolicibacterium litorale]|uniref:Aspartate aminotransferase family protein n=1 Tax=Mycolicibacterium litorale TaxID=758802 RepID=A0A6S6P4G7_9MYCO|nr:aspartate aminotransferase family protein [Mycolicibacterium litorale]BCI52287.1 aspartate aminotransferase family protein [Mycolicibacterium litorale]
MSPKSLMPNGFDPAVVDDLAPELRSIVARRRDVLGPSLKLFYRKPVEVARASGVHLYDSQGNAYLDVYNNVPCVGHCHPHVVEAIAKQAATLNSNTRYLTTQVLDYSERILGTHADGLDKIMYACSGSEANDLALRVARYATGNDAVIVTSNAYHGITATIAEISPSLGDKVPLGSRTVRIAAPACVAGGDVHEAGRRFAADVENAVAHLERHGMRLAALIVDPLFASDGLAPQPAGFLAPAVDVVHRAGGLFIADEVQSGFARSGDAMWGYQRHGITPDIVTMGKPMGNGLPISAVVAHGAHLERFGKDIRYFNTFAGNSVCIAAAAATLDVLEREELLANAATVGAVMCEGLAELCTRYPFLTEARHAGLFLAADLVDPETGAPDDELALAVVNGLRDRRILVSTSGPDENVLKVRPPLVFTADNAEFFIAELDQVLRELS